jgi:hypothetical protein
MAARMGKVSAAMLVVLAVMLPRSAAAGSAFIPDYLRLQFAGQAGFMSVGPGYSWWDRKLETGLSYGFVPETVGERNIHILSQKNSLSPVRFKSHRGLFVEPVLVGVASHLTVGRKYEVVLPESQRDYYWPDGLFFWFFSGAKAGYMAAKPGPIAGMAAQLEVGTINQYVKSYTANGSVELSDILSLAISAQFYL